MTKTTSVTKKALSLLLALLMLCSGLAISASATTEADETVPAKPVFTLDIENKSVTVQKPAEGVNITIEPTAPNMTADSGDILFYNLKEDTEYTLTAAILVDEKPVTSSVTFKLLKKGKVPSAPIPTDIKSTSITVIKADGCEYMLKGAKDNDGKDIYSTWSDTVEFKGLVPETAYTVAVRTKAVANVSYASEEVTTTITTKMAPPTEEVSAPVLVDKTNTTITVAAVDGVEFSINKGATWDASGNFTKLTPATSYSIIARRVLKANQEPGATSEALNVKTNTRASYQADVNRCTFVGPTGKVYANETQTFTVSGDTYGVGANAEFGDTRLVPQSFTAGDKTNADFTGSGVTGLKGSFTPGKDNAEKTMDVKVTYRLEKFVGGNQWETVKTVEKSYQVKVGPVNDTLNKIKEGFEKVINFLLNDVPSLISKVIGSEIWGKLGKAIEGLLGMLNK